MALRNQRQGIRLEHLFSFPLPPGAKFLVWLWVGTLCLACLRPSTTILKTHFCHPHEIVSSFLMFVLCNSREKRSVEEMVIKWIKNFNFFLCKKKSNQGNYLIELSCPDSSFSSFSTYVLASSLLLPWTQLCSNLKWWLGNSISGFLRHHSPQRGPGSWVEMLLKELISKFLVRGYIRGERNGRNPANHGILVCLSGEPKECSAFNVRQGYICTTLFQGSQVLGS